MTLTEWLAIWFISAVVVAPFIGEWLHRRREDEEFNQSLVGQAARDRKARIDAWLTTEEKKYMDSIDPPILTNYAEVVTRDDAEPFHLQDEQPIRPLDPAA